jgi:hypothetical protein
MTDYDRIMTLATLGLFLLAAIIVNVNAIMGRL